MSGMFEPENFVELRPAFIWTCDGCGEENYERATVHENSDEVKGRMLESYNLGDKVGGHFLSCPTEVTCKCCKRTYKTKDFDEE